jgi:hypothetical protein
MNGGSEVTVRFSTNLTATNQLVKVNTTSTVSNVIRAISELMGVSVVSISKGEGDEPLSGEDLIVDHLEPDLCFTVKIVLKFPPVNIDVFRNVIHRKPAIYLYPSEAMRVSVGLGFDLTSAFIYPPFTRESTWIVDAEPSGRLVVGESVIPYLFWEGSTPTTYNTQEGFNVSGGEVVSFLERRLPHLGLNRQEMFDFIVYWGPRLAAHSWVFLQFETVSYAAQCPLIVDPVPDSVIRVMMRWRVIPAPIEGVVEPVLVAPTRRGFTLVEWGGEDAM